MMYDVLILLSPSIVVFVYLLLRQPRQQTASQQPPVRTVLVDGSNVMFWRDNTPRLDTVQAVVAALRAQGWQPEVWFDANAGHHLAGRYLRDYELARLLGLSSRQIIVVPKGTPADPALMASARGLAAPVVSNDRFRDWQADYADVLAGAMIRGWVGPHGVVFETERPVLMRAA